MRMILTEKTDGINVISQLVEAIKYNEYVKIETGNEEDAVDNLIDVFKVLKAIDGDITIVIETPGSCVEVKPKDILVYKDPKGRVVIDAE